MNGGIEVRIDTLVCDGFDVVDGPTLGRALERDLAQLLSERGLPAALRQDHAVRAIVAPAITLPFAAAPAVVARELARAIYDGLDR